MAAMSINIMSHRPNPLDLVPVDCLLFPKVKVQLGGIPMTQETFQMTWDGVKRTIAKETYTAASRRRHEQNKKYI
jgi:hypothetical protein